MHLAHSAARRLVGPPAADVRQSQTQWVLWIEFFERLKGKRSAGAARKGFIEVWERSSTKCPAGFGCVCLSFEGVFDELVALLEAAGAMLRASEWDGGRRLTWVDL